LGAMAIIGLLMLPAFIYAILMSLRYSLAVPACVVEDPEGPQGDPAQYRVGQRLVGRIILLALLVFVIKVHAGHGHSGLCLRGGLQASANCRDREFKRFRR